MLKTGDQHLDSLRDGRRVYIGDELVEDDFGRFREQACCRVTESQSCRVAELRH